MTTDSKSRGIAAFALAAAVLIGGIAIAGPASATEPTGERLGDITMTPATGPMTGMHDWLNAGGVMSTATGCAADDVASQTWVVNSSGQHGQVSEIRYTGDGDYGFGQPNMLGKDSSSSLDNIILNRGFFYGTVTPLEPAYVGDFDVVITCSDNEVTWTPTITDPRYFSVTLTSDGTNWTVKGGGTPVEKADTELGLAGVGNPNGSVSITATVTADDATATTATGSVSFSATDVTGGSANVLNGVATWTSPVLTANTEYTFTASYAGDANFEGSTGTIPVETVPQIQDPITTTITVTIPAGGPGTLSFEGAGTATLGALTEGGGAFTGTGKLSTLTVTDSRPVKGVWGVNGQVSEFTATGLTPVPASSLGWTPGAVGTLPIGVTLGSTVAPGVGASAGLADGKTLVSAALGYGGGAPTVVTTVDADLAFSVPTSTAQGSYTATLTLTLI